MSTSQPRTAAGSPTVVLDSDPWGPTPGRRQVALDVSYDESPGVDDAHRYSWEELSGPFCSCGDFACPGGTHPQACPERSHGGGSFYPEHWTDKDIDDYEFEFAIYAARADNHEDAQLAAARLARCER